MIGLLQQRFLTNIKEMRKKYYLYLIFGFLASTQFYAQDVESSRMGINTETPTRAMDINGKLKITKFQNKGTDPQYKDIVVADSDGDVDRSPKHAINQTQDLQIEVAKNVFLATGNEANAKVEEVTIGPFKFALNKGVPSMKLAKQPQGTVSIQYGLKRMTRQSNLEGGNSFNTGNGNYLYDNYTLSFNASTWNNYQRILSTNASESTFHKRDFYRFHLIYPGEPYLYRVTFIRIQNSGLPVSSSSGGAPLNNMGGSPFPDLNGDGSADLGRNKSTNYNRNFRGDTSFNNNTSKDIYAIICERFTATF